MASNSFFGTRTVTAGATAVSVDSLIRGAPGANQAPAYAGSGIGCALNFSADIDIYVGTDSAVTDSGGGAPLSADTPFTDYATGMMGNVCDPTQWYVYTPSDDATLTVMFRGM